jgi:hypothetical protein
VRAQFFEHGPEAPLAAHLTGGTFPLRHTAPELAHAHAHAHAAKPPRLGGKRTLAISDADLRRVRAALRNVNRANVDARFMMLVTGYNACIA